MGVRNFLSRKPVIALAPHPLTGEGISGVHGQVVMAFFKGKVPRVEVLGRLHPHPEEVDFFIRKLEEMKSDVGNRLPSESGFKKSLLKKALDIPTPRAGFFARDIEVLEKLLASGKISHAEFVARRNFLLDDEAFSFLQVVKGEDIPLQRKEVIKALVNEFRMNPAWRNRLLGLQEHHRVASARSRDAIARLAMERYGVRLHPMKAQGVEGTFEPSKNQEWDKAFIRLFLKKTRDSELFPEFKEKLSRRELRDLKLPFMVTIS